MLFSFALDYAFRKVHEHQDRVEENETRLLVHANDINDARKIICTIKHAGSIR
jgi:hypothetical protein